MGNCIALQKKVNIKIMKADGEILKFQSPLKVHEALEQFPGYVISDVLPVVRQLDPMADMRCGQLYHLLKQKPSDAKDGLVRIKLVLSKQELKELLSKGEISLDAMLAHLQKEPSEGEDNKVKQRCIGWSPDLESIPEGCNFC